MLPYFWLPEEASARRWERNRVPYPAWARDGHVVLTDGNITDYDRIREDVRALSARFRIREIGYDRWNATQLVTQLTEDGANMVPIGQGFASMNAPAKELEKLVAGRELRHDGHPVLSWMVANAVVRQDPAGNIKPDRERSADKIDGVVALVMALARAIVSEPEPTVSVLRMSRRERELAAGRRDHLVRRCSWAYQLEVTLEQIVSGRSPPTDRSHAAPIGFPALRLVRRRRRVRPSRASRLGRRRAARAFDSHR